MKSVVTYEISIRVSAMLAHDVGIQNMHFLIQIMEKFLLDKIMEFIMRQKFLSKFVSDEIIWNYSFLSQTLSGFLKYGQAISTDGYKDWKKSLIHI